MLIVVWWWGLLRVSGGSSHLQYRRRDTVGVIKICALVFHELLSLGWIFLQNLCVHHQENLLTIPKHPQLANFGWFWVKLWQFKDNKVPKNNFDWQFSSIYKQIFNYYKTSLFWNCHNLLQNHLNFASWGCFGIVRRSS